MDSSGAERAGHAAGALAELRSYLERRDEAARVRAVDALRSAAHASSNALWWVAIGFLLDAGGEQGAALDALQRAVRLDPDDHAVEIFVLTLLAELGMEEDAMSGIRNAADRGDVDLESLEREVMAAGMPVDARTLLQNGFIQPRYHVMSDLESVVSGVGSDLGGSTVGCEDLGADVEAEISPADMPPELRGLFPWVCRLGVGDDPCRVALAQGLTTDEREALQRELGRSAAAAHAWLDTFVDVQMPPAAAAVMYTLLAAEELALGDSGEPGDAP